MPGQTSRGYLLTNNSLPLLRNNGAGLAIAVSTYFDDVNRHGRKKDEKTPSESTKEKVKSNFGWLPQVPNITRNLKNAFTLWDAVSLLFHHAAARMVEILDATLIVRTCRCTWDVKN
jgi:hypothetical protein